MSAELTPLSEQLRTMETDPATTANGRTSTPRTNAAEAVEVFRRWLHVPDPGHIYATLSAVVANRLDGDPLWLLLVGPPSSGKSETLAAINGLPCVHPAATLTEAALLSGTPKKEHAAGAKGGLLRAIDHFGILLLKDFTSILAQNRDTRSQVLAALREVYDGSWTRHLGTGGGVTLHWEGKVGLIGGCTAAIDQHHAVMSALGERFMLYRLPEVDAADVGGLALEHLGAERKMRADLAEVARAVIEDADIEAADRPLTPAERDHLVNLATFATRCRSAVARDGYTHEVLAIPQAEGPARFLLGLRRLMGGLEAISTPETALWDVLARVALDSMPATRRALLEHLTGVVGTVRTSQAARAVDLPTKTAHRHLEDLAMLKLVVRDKTSQADNAPDLWSVSDWTRLHWPAERPDQGEPK